MATGIEIDLNFQRLLSLPKSGPSFAIIFPGQGAQSVGMARDAFEHFESARLLFAIADEISGANLRELCFDGPEESLTDTANAQPAILAASLAYLAAAVESGKLRSRPSYFAGHSLGEYTALVAAGALTCRDAIALVCERGRIMAQAGRRVSGSMAAILGLDEERVLAICKTSGAEPANFNGPTQTVVGGSPTTVNRAMQLAKESGGKALPVRVSGAFHTSLMAQAAERFSDTIDSASVKDPEVPVIGNVRALPLTTAGEVLEELRQQIARPVQWSRSVEYMLGQGVRSFVEVGPGRVLAAMLKRQAPAIECLALDSAEMPALP
jgi:[acyl-carrier-protein] S-malonyltransferase